MYTVENTWITYFHGKDFAHLSIFSERYWENVFRSFKTVRLVQDRILKLPPFFESLFLLRKQSQT